MQQVLEEEHTLMGQTVKINYDRFLDANQASFFQGPEPDESRGREAQESVHRGPAGCAHQR